MAIPLDEIPDGELASDLSDALHDAENCEKALRVGLTYVCGMLISDRLAANQQHIEIIRGELDRRGIDVEVRASAVLSEGSR